jgi:hypothetical protein
MEFPVITAATAGVLLIFQQLLMLSVGMYRVKVRRGVGHGEDLQLERLVRRHGNLAENAAVFLVGLGLLELATGSGPVTLGFAGVFLAARLFHALGFSSLAGSHLAEGSKLFLLLRSSGAILSALAGVALGGYLLARLAAG